MQQYMRQERQQCRRVIIDRYLDGRTDRSRCEGDEEACDQCEGRVFSESASDVEDRQAREVGTQALEAVGTQAPEVGTPASEAVGSQVSVTVSTQASEMVYTQAPASDRGRTQAPALDRGHTQAPETERADSSTSALISRWRPGALQSNALIGSSPLFGEFQRQEQARQRPQQRRVGQEQGKAQLLDAIVQRVSEWKNRCAVCFIHGRKHQHTINECADLDGQAAAKKHGEVMGRGGISFVRNIVCFKCGLPQQVCDRWRGGGVAEIEGGRQKKCRFFRVMSGIVYGIRQGHPQIWQEW